MPVIIKVIAISIADGGHDPHAGRFVVRWSPHTRAGTLDLTSSPDPAAARRFADATEALIEWSTVSRVQTARPWDRKPNKPLTGVTVQILDAPDG